MRKSSDRNNKSSSGNIEEVYSEFDEESLGNSQLNVGGKTPPPAQQWGKAKQASDPKKADGSSNLDEFDDGFDDKYDDDDFL